MNKAKLLEQLKEKAYTSLPSGYRAGLLEAIDLVEQLTCITDPTFPADIKEPVTLRDYGMLYLVKDGSSPWYYITRKDKWLARSVDDERILELWDGYVNKYYPETRETK